MFSNAIEIFIVIVDRHSEMMPGPVLDRALQFAFGRRAGRTGGCRRGKNGWGGGQFRSNRGRLAEDAPGQHGQKHADKEERFKSIHLKVRCRRAAVWI